MRPVTLAIDNNCNSEMVEMLLKFGANINNALMIYLEHDDISIENGPDINHKNWENETPLLIACTNRNVGLDIVKLLI